MPTTSTRNTTSDVRTFPSLNCSLRLKSGLHCPCGYALERMVPNLRLSRQHRNNATNRSNAWFRVLAMVRTWTGNSGGPLAWRVHGMGHGGRVPGGERHTVENGNELLIPTHNTSVNSIRANTRTRKLISVNGLPERGQQGCPC